MAPNQRGSMSRRSFLRNAALGGAAVAGSALVSACAPAAPQAPAGGAAAPGAAVQPTTAPAAAAPVTVTFMDINPAQNVEFVKELLTRFEASHPQVKINYQNVPADQAHQKVLVDITAGAPPDTFYMPSQWIGELGAMGALEDLEPYIAGSPNKDLLLPHAHTMGRAYKGKLYTIPSEIMVDGIFYRVDYFKEAGIANPPANWDEMLDAALKLTDPANNRYGFSMRGGSGSWRYYMLWLTMGTGGKIFDEDGTCLWNTPDAVDALQWYADLYTKHKVASPATVNNGFMETVDEFSAGTAAMYIHNNYSISKQVWALGDEDPVKAQEKFNTVPIPAGPKGRYVAAVSNTFPVMAGSKNKQATWDFIDFLVTQENNSYWCKSTGALPINQNVYDEEWIRTDPFMVAFLEELEDVDKVYVFPDHLPEFGTMTGGKMATETFQKVLLGEMSAQAAADAIAEELTKANQKFMAENA